MNRSQFIAALLVVGVLGALVAGRIARDDGDGSAAGDSDQPTAAASGSTPAEGGDEPDEPAEAAAVDGDETAVTEAPADDAAAQPDAVEAPPILDPKPALVGIDGWINTDATSLDDFAGQVRVVEFWTFGCFNCKNRLPHTQELYAEYQPKGLEIIAIHAPEFEYERDPAAVAEASERLGVVWPVALDTEKANFRAWQGSRRFWPRVYVLDQNGDLRYDHIGEGDYDGLEETVAYLLEHGP